VLLDEKQYENMQNGLADLTKFWKEQANRNRDEFPNAAPAKGKFTPSQRAHYQALWDINAETIRNLVNSLASDTAPVEEIGRGGTGADAVDDTAYDDRYLTPAGKARIKNAQEA
jgi:hypothetical protein